MKGLCLFLLASAVALCGVFPQTAEAQLFGGRSTVRINNPGRANDVFIRAGNGGGNAANVAVANGFGGSRINVATGFRGANVNVVNGFGGANVAFVNPHANFAFAAPARFNTFGTRTVVTPAGIYEVDAFGNSFFRAPQAAFVPATAFGGYGGFGVQSFAPQGFGTFSTFGVRSGFCH